MTRFFTRLMHWFVPHRGNGYHPHFLRRSGLITAALMIAFMPTFYNLSTTGEMQVLGYATDISAAGLNAATNQQRASNGLAGYSMNSLLSQAAANKAADMFADNYWAHTAPDGTTPWWFISNAGYAYSSAGENLAKNFMTSSGVVTGWMNSSSHRANLLSSTFTEVGYGVANGVLQGEEVTLVVAMYGAPPAPAPKPAESSQPVSSPPATSVQQEAAPVAESAPVAEAAPAEETTAPVEQEVTHPAEEVASQPEQVTTTEPTGAIQSVTAGEVAGAMVTAPLRAYGGLNWGQKSVIFIMATMTLLFVMSHTLLWRAKKRGVPHVWFRAHPLAQAGLLSIAIVIVLASGTGVVL